MSNELDGPNHALLLEIRDGVRQVRERVDILGGLSQLSNQVKAISGKLDVVIAKEDSTMAAIDDMNARLDEIQGKVTKIGADLAAEVALLQNAGAGGLSSTDFAASMARLQTISDNLTAVDVTTPPVPPTA